MALKKVPVKTGLNRENTNYAGEGGYYNCDKIRFRSGYAEKIGGWVTNSVNSFAGVCRSLFNWVTLDSQALTGVGTNQRYYLQNSGTFYPITPIVRNVSIAGTGAHLVNNPFTTLAGSNLVTVTDAGFLSSVGSFVNFTGCAAFVVVATTAAAGNGTTATVSFTTQVNPPAVGSVVTVAGVTPAGYNGAQTVTASTASSISFTNATTGVQTVAGTVTLPLNGSYEIVTVGAGTYTIYSPGATTSISGGGAVVDAAYELSASSAIYSALTNAGWGISNWGSGGWGTSTGGSIPLALWSQANWGEDFIFSPRGGAIYYWVKNTTADVYGNYTPATTINAYAATQVKTFKTVAAGVVASTTFVVTDTADIDVGSVITLKSGAATIVAGTYVTTAWAGGTTITVTPAVSITAGAQINFSYSGKTAPNTINQIGVFSVYQFVVALGSTPYDPSNFTPAFNPMLVRWSDQSVAAEWTATTFNQSGESILSNGSYIVGGAPARQEFLIWTDRALYSMQYIGAPFVFTFQILMDNISIMSPNAMITVNNITYWMGVDKFYTYSGTVQTLPCTVRQYVMNNLNISQSFQVICGHNEEYSEVWWHYPSTNSMTNDSYVTWNYVDNNWAFGTLNRTAWYDTPLVPNPIAVISVQNPYLTAAITAVSTTIPVADCRSFPISGIIVIDSEQIAYTTNGGTFFGGLTRGYNSTTAASHVIASRVTQTMANQLVLHEIGVDDGSVSPAIAIPAYIETSDFDIDDGDHYVFISRIIPDLTFDSSTAGSNPRATLTLTPRDYPGSAYGTPYASSVVGIRPPPTPPTAYPVEEYTGVLYSRVRGRQVAFKIESNKLGTTWQLGFMRFDIRTDGRR
ncbi:MAG: hypothetical protein WCO52_05945 [bacterium]